jgi:hypothetical protein
MIRIDTDETVTLKCILYKGAEKPEPEDTKRNANI